MVENVIIYGIGYYGCKAIKRIEEKYLDVNIVGVTDTLQTSDIGSYQNIALENVANKKDINIVIAISSMESIQVVWKKVHKMGFKGIYAYLKKDKCCGNNFLQDECICLNSFNDRSLLYAEMHVVDFCNLNCRGCAHFSAIFPKEYPNEKKRLRDIEILTNVMEQIKVFSLMGGEPLLNPDICNYIIGARKYLPNTEIQLVTNGLLIPHVSERIFECIQSNRITVSISEYKPTHQIMDKIINRLEKYEVDYVIRSYDKKQKFGLPLARSIECEYSKTCLSSGCVNICDGKIAKCPTLMYISRFNEVFGENLPTEGVLDLEETMNPEQLKEFLEKKVPLCQHCIDKKIDWSPCGKQVKVTDFAL